MTIDFPRDLTGDFPNGTWRAMKRDGKLAANFCCPLCGFRGGLGHGSNHEIDRAGFVRPSVVCDGAGCTFHEYIKLSDWNEAWHKDRAEREGESAVTAGKP